MKAHNTPACKRDGVALIVCLGLLAVMTLLAVTFSVAMRVERMASRNYADGVRAKHLVQASLVRAMEAIDQHMAGPPVRVYPSWDVMASSDPRGDAANLLTPQAMSLLPAGELMDLAKAERPQWINGVDTGRVAFLIVNTSGLVDINSAGASARQWSTNFAEIDIRGAPEVKAAARTADRKSMINERDALRRYETIDEIRSTSSNLDQNVQSFQTFSYDVGHDKVFLTRKTNDLLVTPTSWFMYIDTARPPEHLGQRDAEEYLHDKFNLNSITNFPVFYNATTIDAYVNDANFMSEYYRPLTNMLCHAGLLADKGERPDDVAWNIINYLDPDRIPQGSLIPKEGYYMPWVHSEGGEAIPLINELAIEKVDIPGGMQQVWVPISNPRAPGFPGYFTNVVTSGGPGYVVNVEVWYPFAPVVSTKSDDFYLQVMVFNQQPVGVTPIAITDAFGFNTNCSVTVQLPPMQFGTTNEYVVVKTPPLTFPTNGLGMFSSLGDVMGSKVNEFWTLARVIQARNGTITPLDEGPAGYNPNQGRNVLQVNALMDYQVNDPRSNGQLKYWQSPNGGTFPTASHTLGAKNTVCMDSQRKGQGTPIYYPTNGLMSNIGEIGNIWRSNLDDEMANPADWWWRTLNLMKKDEGAMLLDMWSVRNSRPPISGVFCASSRQTSAWNTVFYNLSIGLTNVSNVGSYRVDPYDIMELIKTLQANSSSTNWVSFYDMFTAEVSDAGGGGELAEAFRACAPNAGVNKPDIYREDTFRSVCELLTFRQNIFTIILGAQVMSPDGRIPISERHAIATVYRDAYTGRHFTRSFKWLDD